MGTSKNWLGLVFCIAVLLVGDVGGFYDKYCQIPCDFVETAVPHTVCTRIEQVNLKYKK